MDKEHSVHSAHSRSKLYRLGKNLLQYGVADLFLSPRKAARYWRGIASAGLQDTYPSWDLSCIPICDFEAILPGYDSIPVTLTDYQYQNGDMPAHELLALCRFVRYRKPKKIFEIATFLGGTTLQLAANSCSDAVVYTLDLPPPGHPDYVPPKVVDASLDVYPSQPGIRFKDSVHAGKIYQIFGDSQTYDFSAHYGTVDLMLIDGCHHHEFVQRDTENALKMRAPDGVIFWHDYAPHAPDVVNFLNQLCRVIPLSRISGTSLIFYAGQVNGTIGHHSDA